ncbi:Cc-nbs-lrr resistance protein [Artemisia annua]|uniref:Cc-nbs-lrr resistance protein n=1 Tax=Artemisia annua TaxID=35608 RepID=A0A2U1NVL9_ARTAN|nr:Cc-nbs-lrr resistance protein [Artemisia annua]
MVDALVTVAAEGILKKALSIAANEVSIALGYKDKLIELHDTLEMIRAKLSDAEGKKGTEGVMLWLKQLNDVVGEADDVLDKAHYEMLRREVKKRNHAGKIFSFTSLKKFSFGREIGRKIENVNKKLSQISERAKNLGLENEKFELDGNSRPSGTVPNLDEFKIVGRENDEQCIVKLLISSREGEKLTIVPIVGMGGIGKTTLAKSIYNNPKIEQHFDVRAWLCVSVKVEVDTLLADIYESLAGEKVKSLMRVNLIRNLQEKLGSKRYLLVLDDVWDDELAYWDEFRNCMLQLNSEIGSSIIVTTRKLNIGRNATIEKSYELESLSDDECWSMFKERALLLPEFEEIGRDIVKKCCGLPLLVNVLGSMLRHYNTDKGKWLSIQDSKVWDFEGRERVLSTLKLSFDNLPNSMVKQCFVYCSIFEKDEVIGREELVQLWMALGLVHTDTKTNKEMEEVGNDIFQILVSNSLFQNVKKYEYGDIYGGDIYGCQMHDLVHDLLLSLSSHEISRLVVSDDVQIPPVKHLALQRRGYENSVFDIFKEDMKKDIFKEDIFKEDMKKTRSLQTLFFLGDVKNISLKIFKCLRILKLSRSSLDEVPESVGELVHLRYLDLSYTNIRTLPKSIGKLYHLQTLKRCTPSFTSSDLEFPQETRNLISLRHLMYDSRFQAPKDVGLLTSLRTLPSFQVGRQKGRQIEELGHLKHLSGKLRICNLEEIDSKEEAVKADLHGKQNLYEIEFRWSSCDEGGNRNDKDVLEGLQPAANVKSLEIENYSGNSFPEWAMKMKIKTERNWIPLAKLVKIKLTDCRNCLNIPMLEDLPLLQDLVLWNMNKVTCLSSSSDQRKPLSPSLRSLLLWCMENLEKWTHAGMNSSTMLSPVLEKLEIYTCPKIILLDESLQHPLKYLRIMYCKNLESVRSIQGLTSLQSLDITGCDSLLEIPDLHNQRRSLKGLTVNQQKLTCLPGGFDCLSLLNTLKLGQVHSFPSLSGIEKLGNHLKSLELFGWKHWESIPEDIKHLNALRELTIHGFGVRELPMWLTNMSSIREIRFWNCRGLNEESVLQGAPREATRVYLNGGWNLKRA